MNLMNRNWFRFQALQHIQQFLTEGAWIAFGQLSSAVGLVLALRILTEYLPPNVFGIVSLLLGILALGLSTFCLPLLQGALRFYPDLARKGQISVLRHTINHWLQRSAAFLIAFILFAGAIISIFQRVSYLTFLVLAALLAFEIIRAMETHLLTAARRQRPFSIWLATDTWARGGLAILGVIILGPTAFTVLLGYLAGTAIVLMIFMIVLRREGLTDKETSPKADLGLFTELRNYSLPLIPLGIVGWISSLSDRYIIGGMLGIEQVGIYAATYGLISKPFVLAQGILETAIRPIYFNAVSAKSPDFKNIFKTYFLFTLIISILGVLTIFQFGKMIIELCLGPKYYPGIHLAPWIALGNAALIVSYTFYTRLYAYKLTKEILAIRIISAILCLPITFIFTYIFGLIGAAIACPIYFGFECLILSIQAKGLWPWKKAP